MKEKKIGDILLNVRQKAKISQDLLSQKLHISRQCISNWENNYNVPDLEMLKEICKILNISYKKIIKKHPAYRTSNQKPPKIIIFLLFLILLFIIIFCLMIKFRTKVAFYEVKIAKNDNVSLTNAYFLKTNNNIYFNLGIISFLSSTENIEDYQVKLYLKTKDKIRLIINCNYEDFIIINEKNGYGEYFDNDFGSNALFLDLISLDDSTKIYSFKLKLEEKFKNDKVFNFKQSKIVSDKTNDLLNHKLISTTELKKQGYEYNDNSYSKKVDNGTFQYDEFFNELMFFNNNTNLKFKISYDVIVGRDYDYQNNKYLIDFVYNKKSNQLSCYSDTCQNYEEYIKIILDEYKSLAN